MTILPLHPAQNASPDALRAFLAQCRAAAERAGRPKLVSISLAVDALDPLAVLESIFEPTEPHFYAERPDIATAIAGAETAAGFEAHGRERFAAVQRWVDETLEHTIAVGDVNAPLGGPHFFTGFTFLDETEAGEPFPAVRVWVPRWQIARAGAVTTAVANLLVEPGADLDPLTERVWRAHGKFSRFEYRGVAEESGTGVPPVSVTKGSAKATGGTPVPPLQTHGRDARATSRASATPFTLAPIEIRHGAYLPHWTREGAIYAMTFRLADSLPEHVTERWRLEREALKRRAEQPGYIATAYEKERLQKLHSEQIETLLDAGHGRCVLKRPEIATLVAGALAHFDGERYELHDWCIMPNHVHVILRPLPGQELTAILHSWKSYTAHEAQKLLGQEGDFWQAEYFDHLIRDEADYQRTVEYVRGNPERAGLKDWRWCGTGGTPVRSAEDSFQAHGRDARATSDPRAGRPCHSDEGAQWETQEAGDYRAAVARALQLIKAGEFSKIVLARAQDFRADRPLHPLRVLNGLRQRFPDCYAFSMANGRGQSFIGASPEQLVRVSKGVLETAALAGTTRRGAGASEDAALAAALLASDKDRREHQFVLESITGRLKQLGLAPKFPERPGIRRLANVQHLQTPVSAELPANVRLLDALAQLYPTPAVGGTPQAAAVARIRELEGFPRGLYAGALGWMNARGGGEFFVGLRSALVDGATARVYAGAGIVEGSTPEKEFAETELKFKAMLDALRS